MKAKLYLLTILVTLLMATSVKAQQPVDESSKIRKGEHKIRIGLSLIAAGALVIPATYILSDRLSRASAATGAGLMMGGGLVVAFGMRDREKAIRPARTTLLTVNRRRAAVQFRSAW